MIIKRYLLKATFCVFASLIFVILLPQSNLESYKGAIVAFMLFGFGLHFCYGYIFGVDIHIGAYTIPPNERPKLRMAVFALGVYIVYEISLSILGHGIWDLGSL